MPLKLLATFLIQLLIPFALKIHEFSDPKYIQKWWFLDYIPPCGSVILDCTAQNTKTGGTLSRNINENQRTKRSVCWRGWESLWAPLNPKKVWVPGGIGRRLPPGWVKRKSVDCENKRKAVIAHFQQVSSIIFFPFFSLLSYLNTWRFDEDALNPKP